MPDFDQALRGLKLGKYTIKMKIGAGATADVWKCERADGTLCAVKFVSAQCPLYKNIVKYTKKEFKVYQTCKHPSVLKPIELQETARGFYFFLEFFDGPNAQYAFQHQKSLFVPMLGGYLTKMAASLQYLHSINYIHCDVKPENFLFDTKGVVKLIDFSLVRKKKELPLIGSLIKRKVEGTPEYMSPEQILKKSVSETSDIYSLGLVFYYLLTGKKPFSGKNAEDTVNKNISENPTDVIQLNPQQCCKNLNNLINTMIKKKPNDRISTMTEVIMELRKTRLVQGIVS